MEQLLFIKKISTKLLLKKDFSSLLEMEEKIYPKELIQGQNLLRDIKKGNGLKYSFVASGKIKGKEEKVGYLVAVENKSDQGDPVIYLEDIAVLPEAQGRGIAWEMLKELIKKLQTKAKRDSKPVLWNMHLREASRGLLKKHKEEIEKMGVKIIKEVLLMGYYRNGEDALYRVYEVSVLD